MSRLSAVGKASGLTFPGSDLGLIATPAVPPYVLPGAAAILIALFAIQPQGTARPRTHQYACRYAFTLPDCVARGKPHLIRDPNQPADEA